MRNPQSPDAGTSRDWCASILVAGPAVLYVVLRLLGLGAACLDGDEIFSSHNAGVRRRFERILAERGIAMRPRHRVVSVTADAVYCEGQESLPADAVQFRPRGPYTAGMIRIL